MQSQTPELSNLQGSSKFASKILIIGGGYLGRPLARKFLCAGHEVCLWVKTNESLRRLTHEGFKAISGDVGDPAVWNLVTERFDSVIYGPSTRGGDESDYHHVYKQGLKNACQRLGSETLISFVSSTSVYRQTDGSWVDEQTSLMNTEGKAGVLLECESLALERGGCVARLSGIYGPDRCVLLNRIIEGRPISKFDSKNWINTLHVEDATDALFHLTTSRQKGVFNVTDDLPLQRGELYLWLCQKLNVTPLPFSETTELRKRGLTNKRVRNQKLRSTGWSPKFPTAYEGYHQLISLMHSGRILCS